MGYLVWWTAMNKATMQIDIMRTTSNDALSTICNLYPLYLVAKEVVSIYALRVRESRE